MYIILQEYRSLWLVFSREHSSSVIHQKPVYWSFKTAFSDMEIQCIGNSYNNNLQLIHRVEGSMLEGTKKKKKVICWNASKLYISLLKAEKESYEGNSETEMTA